MNNTNIKSKFLKNKTAIIAWLNKYNITNYELIPSAQYGYTVDVLDNVNLERKYLRRIPVKFGKIDGYFNCSYNNLTSLEFCPVTANSAFYCDHNELTSLEFCPKSVGSAFNCSNNKLTSLQFFPEIIHGNSYFHNNKLIGVDMDKGHNFAGLYKIHCEHKIIAEKSKLEKNIPNKDKKSYNNIINKKIKI